MALYACWKASRAGRRDLSNAFSQARAVRRAENRHGAPLELMLHVEGHLRMAVRAVDTREPHVRQGNDDLLSHRPNHIFQNGSPSIETSGPAFVSSTGSAIRSLYRNADPIRSRITINAKRSVFFRLFQRI